MSTSYVTVRMSTNSVNIADNAAYNINTATAPVEKPWKVMEEGHGRQLGLVLICSW